MHIKQQKNTAIFQHVPDTCVAVVAGHQSAEIQTNTHTNTVIFPQVSDTCIAIMAGYQLAEIQTYAHKNTNKYSNIETGPRHLCSRRGWPSIDRNTDTYTHKIQQYPNRSHTLVLQ